MRHHETIKSQIETAKAVVGPFPLHVIIRKKKKCNRMLWNQIYKQIYHRSIEGQQHHKGWKNVQIDK